MQPNFDVAIINGSAIEIAGNQTTIARELLPVSSPLSGTPIGTTDGSQVSMAVVIPADGRYYVRVGQGDAVYSLRLRTFRNTYEAEPIGTKQKIFLDFNGATIRRDIFANGLVGLGTARLEGLNSFLAGWNLTQADANIVIDKIVETFTSRFVGPGSPAFTGGNGFYSGTGVPGDYDIEILNSRDHADPWGLPNVSRIIIGGSSASSGLPQYAIAQSIDVGNFDRQETAVVLLDQIFDDVGLIPRAPTKSQLDIATDAIGLIAAHEAGHFFGAWHTDNSNALNQIMDQGGNLPGLLGVGLDGIYGTRDDVPTHFGTDEYSNAGISFGLQNTAAVIANGLSTGTQGAYINGLSYFDINVNRTRDAGEPGLRAGESMLTSMAMVFSKQVNLRLSLVLTARTAWDWDLAPTRFAKICRPYLVSE